MKFVHIFRDPTHAEVHERHLEDARRQALEHRADAERSAALADMYEKRVTRLAGSAAVLSPKWSDARVKESNQGQG